MGELKLKGLAAKAASRVLATASSTIKNQALAAMAGALVTNEDAILAANSRDVEAGKAKV
jgi:glutamate-5-semialdehyde dehydrogenase